MKENINTNLKNNCVESVSLSIQIRWIHMKDVCLAKGI